MVSIRLTMSRRLHFFQIGIDAETSDKLRRQGVWLEDDRASPVGEERWQAGVPGMPMLRAGVEAAALHLSLRCPRRFVLIQLSKSDSPTLVKRAGHSYSVVRLTD